MGWGGAPPHPLSVTFSLFLLLVDRVEPITQRTRQKDANLHSYPPSHMGIATSIRTRGRFSSIRASCSEAPTPVSVSTSGAASVLIGVTFFNSPHYFFLIKFFFF